MRTAHQRTYSRQAFPTAHLGNLVSMLVRGAHPTTNGIFYFGEGIDLETRFLEETGFLAPEQNPRTH